MLRTKGVCGVAQNAGERAQWVKRDDPTLDVQHAWEGRQPDPRYLLASQGS